MMVQPMAKPSRPSVRLTALEDRAKEERDKDDEGQKRQQAQMRDGAKPVPFEIGTPAFDERHGQLRGKELELLKNDQEDATEAPATPCQKSLARAVRPRLRRWTTFI